MKNYRVAGVFRERLTLLEIFAQYQGCSVKRFCPVIQANHLAATTADTIRHVGAGTKRVRVSYAFDVHSAKEQKSPVHPAVHVSFMSAVLRVPAALSAVIFVLYCSTGARWARLR